MSAIQDISEMNYRGLTITSTNEKIVGIARYRIVLAYPKLCLAVWEDTKVLHVLFAFIKTFVMKPATSSDTMQNHV